MTNPPPEIEHARAERAAGVRLTFSLASIFIATTLLAITFAVMVYSLWLGAAVFIMATLLFIRIHLCCGPPRPLPWNGHGAKMLGFALLLLICCPIAFCTTCFSGGMGAAEIDTPLIVMGVNDVFMTAVLMGIIAALQTAELLFRLCGSSEELKS